MQHAVPRIRGFESGRPALPPDHDAQSRSGGIPGLCVLFLIGLVLLCIAVGTAAADITVQSDRNPVGLNESFELTFTASGSVDAEPDFSPLQQKLEILSQAKSNRISVNNWDYSGTTQWTLTVMAKRAGTLNLPAIAVGGDRSQPFSIEVLAPAQQRSASDADDEIILEVEAEPNNPYVQAQVLYTVRVLRRVEIAQASLGEPELNDAIIEKLGKDSQHYTQRDGVQYAVIERKYAIFPQQSGPATIPPLELTAEVTAGRRSSSMFNGFFGRQMTRTRRARSEPVALHVRPIPVAFTGKHWLPAEQLILQQHWSKVPLAIPAGEPMTRTVSLTGEGVTVSQLPEIRSVNQPMHSNDGGEIKQYPDQPTLEENKTLDGLTSRREEKTALIPSKAGNYTLPALSFPWWNTRTDRMEIARLPKQVIKALPPSHVDAPASGRKAASTTETAIGSDPLISNDTAPHPTVWQWAALFLVVGWAMTAATWWLHHKRSVAPVDTELAETAEKTATKTIKQACANNRPEQTKDALLAWAKAHWEEPPRSLAEIARRCGNPVQIEIERLSRSLYGRQPQGWQGKDLWQAFLSRQKKRPRKKKTDRPALEPLYKT